MLRAIIYFIFSIILAFPADAGYVSSPAGVRQSGTVTTGDCVEWVGNNLIQDSGGTCGGGGGGGTPGGSQYSIQYNAGSGNFGGLLATDGQLLFGQSSGAPAWKTISGDFTFADTGAATLATVNSDVGTFQGLTVNAKGLVTGAVNENYLAGNQTITLSGDTSGSGTTAITTTLATVNSNVGTFQGLTVNAKGLVTAASNQSYLTAPVANASLANSTMNIGGQTVSLGGATTNQGNGGKIQLSSGTTTTDDCVEFDANGNTVDAGSACGSGGGGGDTITSPNSTLTIGGTATNTTLDFNLSNANTWIGAQTIPLANGSTATTQSAGDNTTKVATDAFVTTAVSNAISGVNPAIAVQAATTSAGNTSGLTYNNGASGIGATFTGSNNTALTIDGFTFTTLGQRLLVKNDTQSPSGAFNGVYYVTQVQATLLPPILTRALDYDQPSDINNTGAIPVINGTVNGQTSWVETATVNTVGTDPLSFTQFSLNPTTLPTLAGANAFTGNETHSGTETYSNGQYITGGAVEQAVYSNGNSGTSLSVNCDNGNVQSVTITDAVTIGLTTPTHPCKFTLLITQDATGHIYSLSSSILWPAGTAPTYSTAANAKDAATMIYDGSSTWGEGNTAFAVSR